MAEALHYPPRDPDRREVAVPVREVTLLEDRAQVTRRAHITLAPGLNRLRVPDVAPVPQDVSLRAVVTDGAARASDARVGRSMRVVREALPEEVRALDEEIEATRDAIQDSEDAYSAATDRLARVMTIATHGLTEIPTDTSWGVVNVQSWHETFEGLFTQARELQQAALDAQFARDDHHRTLQALLTRREALSRTNDRFVAWLDIDVVREPDADDAPGEVELELTYTTPGAMWRPTHSARLRGDKLEFVASGMVWQNTGEDWTEVQLQFSTARSSQSTEPPPLHDDLLQAKRRAEQVQLQARQVAIQSATVQGSKGVRGATQAAPSAPAGVELPGVDDGGDVQVLRPTRPSTIPSDGRPYSVPLVRFEADATLSRVAMPEVNAGVVLRCVSHNLGAGPLLAGPVELVRDSGVVGQTKLLYVAPGEQFELSFGPDDALRIRRASEVVLDRVDPISKKRIHLRATRIDLSNLSDAPCPLTLTERVPISEVEEVRIRVIGPREIAALTEDRDLARQLREDQPLRATSSGYGVDANGLLSWEFEPGPWGHVTLNLLIATEIAPGVDYNPT